MKLFIIPSWYPTKLNPSNGSFFKNWAELLNKANNDVVVVAPVLHSLKFFFNYHQSPKESFKIINEIPTFIHETINIFPKNDQLAFYRYKKHTINLFNKAVKKCGKPDFVLFHSSIWTAAALSKSLNKQKIPFAIEEHLKEFLTEKTFSSFRKNLINETYSICPTIIVPSRALKKAIQSKFKVNNDKIRVIPHPVDEDIFSLKLGNQNNNRINISCVSLLRNEKRIDLIIKAFKNIIQEGINAQLNIIGNGELESQIKKQIEILDLSDKIKLTGYLKSKKIIEELHKTDIFIMASNVETFGMALIEAQACGIPAVVTKCGGPNDIIIEETGILVKPKSIESLTKGLKKMISQLDQYDAKIIREATIKRFGKDIYVESMQNLIDK